MLRFYFDLLLINLPRYYPFIVFILYCINLLYFSEPILCDDGSNEWAQASNNTSTPANPQNTTLNSNVPNQADWMITRQTYPGLSYEEFSTRFESDTQFRTFVENERERTIREMIRNHQYIEGRGWISATQLSRYRELGYDVVNSTLVRRQ